MRHDLESGAWIEVRPVQDLKAKDKDAVSAAVKMLVPITAEGEIDRSQGMSFGGAMAARSRNAILARILLNWSYDMPRPVYEFEQVTNEDSIEELPIDDFNEIEELLAPYMAKLRKRPDPKAKGAATTTGSSGSSRANAARGSRKA
jgi:hypothetical protein